MFSDDEDDSDNEEAPIRVSRSHDNKSGPSSMAARLALANRHWGTEAQPDEEGREVSPDEAESEDEEVEQIAYGTRSQSRPQPSI